MNDTMRLVQRRVRRGISLGAIGALLAGTLTAVGAVSAQAATLQTTITENGSYTVPDGVSEVTFSLYGGAGGSGYGNSYGGAGGAGGRGGVTTISVPVAAGDVFDIRVGKRGDNAGNQYGASPGAGDPAGGGGGNGTPDLLAPGASGVGGGGGGGATTLAVSGGSALAVAGGGGGGGGASIELLGAFAFNGGDGGDAAQDGSPGRNGTDVLYDRVGRVGGGETDDQRGADAPTAPLGGGGSGGGGGGHAKGGGGKNPLLGAGSGSGGAGGTNWVAAGYTSSTGLGPVGQNGYVIVTAEQVLQPGVAVSPASTALVHGELSSVSATVTESGAALDDGRVRFTAVPAVGTDDEIDLGTRDLDATGSASVDFRLDTGTYRIRADFLPNDPAEYASATALGDAITVAQGATGTSISVPHSSGRLGDPVELSARVLPQSPSSGVPTGEIQFLLDSGSGEQELGAAQQIDANGRATLTVDSLPVGANSVLARYLGDASFLGSDSGTATVVVNQSEASIEVVSLHNPTEVGEEAVFRATVSAADGPTPTGLVEFFSEDGSLGTVALSPAGIANLRTTGLPKGHRHIWAVYAGDDHYEWAISLDVVQAVNPGETRVLLSSDRNPAVGGEDVVLTAEVEHSGDGAGTIGGEVQFFADGVALDAPVALTGQTATKTVSDLEPGSHTITAQYLGNADSAESFSTALTQVVHAASTETLLTTSASPITIGQGVTFTGTVVDRDGAPVASGRIQFLNGGVAVGTPQAVNASGTATFTLVPGDLAVGQHHLTARFLGTPDHDASESPVLIQQVNDLAASRVVLHSSQSPSIVGGPVTFTATVEPQQGSGTPSGSVRFYADGASLGDPVALSAGKAELSDVTTLEAGTRLITAEYLGDSGYARSLSPALPQVVEAVATRVQVESDGSPSQLGADVTFTASVIDNVGDPVAVGKVQFFNGSAALGAPVALAADGTASVVAEELAAGDHQITARFLGSGAFPASVSPVLTHRVSDRKAVAVTVGSSASPSRAGAAVDLTARVQPATGSGAAPTGKVQFLVDGIAHGSQIELVSGEATLSTDRLPAGTLSITAAYLGDARFLPGISDPLLQRIEAAETRVEVSSSDSPIRVGLPVTFRAEVSAADSSAPVPSGRVQFYRGDTALGGTQALDASGAAELTRDDLAVGTHEITARYLGDALFDGSRSEIFRQVVKDREATETTLSASVSPSRAGEDVTFTAHVQRETTPSASTPSGFVQFFQDGIALGNRQPLDGSGHAALTTSDLPVGALGITAAYLGDDDHARSTSPELRHRVKENSTAVSFRASKARSVRSEKVTFSVTVTTVEASAPVPAGQVRLQVNGRLVGNPATLQSDGTATLSYGSLPVGESNVSIVYAADAQQRFESSVSETLRFTVVKTPYSAVITTPKKTVDAGGRISVIARLTSTGGPSAVAAGTVQFYANNRPVGGKVRVATTGRSSARLILNNGLRAGKYAITARYTPANPSLNQTARSNRINIRVKSNPVRISAKAEKRTVRAGAQVAVAGRVTTEHRVGQRIGGRISVYKNGKRIGRAHIGANGKFAFFAKLKAGRYGLVLKHEPRESSNLARGASKVVRVTVRG
ncbi:Ig-like domain repeat protein [Leucobacter weissii]|uniref:Ig-like domain repeat protein n=1 Tax=Leucobacter weissii TaxID=1983706 RepID=A0A939MLD4_9MICO|nr:Ig-like domain-containing protein [Leucobacter weissii]MBO1902055.1 Ig-like domain repeat protein [Leucobacter weissii]